MATATTTVHAPGMASARQVCFCSTCNGMTEHTRPHSSVFAHLFFLMPVALCLALFAYSPRELGFFAGAAAFILMFYIPLTIGGHQRRRHQLKCVQCKKVTQH